MEAKRSSNPRAAPIAEELRPPGGASVASVKAARLLQVGDHTVLVAEPSMLDLYDAVARVAHTSLPVLIHGETGTGKEVIAEAIHLLSNRARKKLVKLNCAAIPSSLVESELFGYERGAFTGAVRSRPGLLAEASEGTLFLDEIGELPDAMQVKLLRVLEDGRVRRLGATSEFLVDIRIISATNRDLKAMMTAGLLRKDFYYRISSFSLEVPPLRARRQEISLLAEHCLRELCQQTGRVGVSFAPDVIEALEAYQWPGNIRELRNVISRALVLCDSPITIAHLPDELREAASDVKVAAPEPKLLQLVPNTKCHRAQMRDVERQRLLNALEAAGWNQTKAAKALEMPRRTLVWKLASLKIERPPENDGEDEGV
ncbi:MAG TPA: sigma-54 dependent transcriptional regulator [Candidatus Acidoferrales bacterium]|nr:sigma-54 dependent transcriptional regulator [Candidatus Acidoferrales bacterium]